MPGMSRIRLWQVIRKEFKQLLRDPKAKPLLLGSPIVQFILLAYASTTDVERISTIVVDHDRSADSRALVEAWRATGYFDVTTHSDDPTVIIQGLDRGEAVLGVVIPPGFSRDVRSGRGATIQAIVDGSDASVATVAQSYVSQVSGRFGARVAGLDGTGRGVELRARAWFNPSLKSRLFNVPAIMATLILMTGLMLTTMCVVREREIGTLDQLQVSPVTAGEIMIGKTVPVFAVGVFHFAIFMVLTLGFFEVPFRGSALQFGTAAVVFLLSGMAIGLFISAVSATQQEAFMLMILTMLPTIVLSGMLSPVSSMPVGLQWITLANPVRHFLDIVRGLFLKGAGFAELWPQFGALVAIAGGTLIAATRQFERSIR